MFTQWFSPNSGFLIQQTSETLGDKIVLLFIFQLVEKTPCSLSHRPFLTESARKSWCFHSVIVLSVWNMLNENRTWCLYSPISCFTCDPRSDFTGQKDVKHVDVTIWVCVLYLMLDTEHSMPICGSQPLLDSRQTAGR